MALQFGGQILRQIRKASAQQGFHDDGGNLQLLQLVVEVVGVNIVFADLVGEVPVQIVQLYLHEIPMVLVVQGKNLVEHLLLAMKRETEVADAAGLSLLHEEVHHAVVHITRVELLHSAANGVQQVVVDIVHLQLLHGVAVHLDGLLALMVLGIEVRELRGYEVLRALVAAQRDTRAAFRLSLTVDGTGVDIVQSVLQGVVNLTVNHLLVELLVIIGLRRQTHHAVAQQRHLLLGLRVHAVGHLTHRRLHLVFVFLGGLATGLVGLLATCQRGSRCHRPCAKQLQEGAS